ncbi:MAG: LapA family protein [Ilumatobacteraceae bacterium]
MEPSERPTGQVESADRAAGAAAGTQTAAETRGARFARGAHRTRLYLYAGAAVALLVVLVALVLANTGHVKVSWVFGAASVSLVWLVLVSAILGLVLGMVIGALFRWRTRTPRS